MNLNQHTVQLLRGHDFPACIEPDISPLRPNRNDYAEKRSKLLIMYPDLRSISETIILLCIEKEDEFCHRHILKKLIEEE